MLAPNTALHPFEAAVAILCIAVGGGCGRCDQHVVRPRYRRVDVAHQGSSDPVGCKVDADEALAFGIVLSIASVVTMTLVANVAAGALLAFSILFYVAIYTMWLKRSTAQNIVIGGAAGAFPPVIGWAAATGEVSLAAIVLFLIVFMWTPPHFWALALFRAGDYAKAGVPMLPVDGGQARDAPPDPDLFRSRCPMLGVVPYFLGVVGPVYAAMAALLGFVFVAGALGPCGATARTKTPTNPISPSPPPSGCSAIRSSICSCCSGLMLLDRVALGAA